MRYCFCIAVLFVSLVLLADDNVWNHGDITICQGEELTLVSSRAGADAYRWSTSDAGFVPGTTSSSYIGTIPQTMDVTVEALSKERLAENNLMSNGGFESNPPVGFESDYVYKGFDPNPLFGPGGVANDQSGLYVISSSARRSANTFQNILPHSGNYFMLVDGNKSGDAWRTSTTLSSSLVVEQDSEYVFSYWAANINSQQENGHPARLQFQISLDGGTTRTNLGQAYTLPCDGKWHYQEVIYKAPSTSTNVVIAVVDLTTHYGVGNDFALDDIMFQPLTEESYQVVYTDIYHIIVEDCTEDPCADFVTQVVYRDTTVCDTLLPYTWMGHLFEKTDSFRTVISSQIGCGDSIVTWYRLSTVVCEPERCEDVVLAKWDDALYVNNGESGLNGMAVSYQWYKDNLPISGETSQVYYAPDGSMANGVYYAVVTLSDGTIIMTCPKTFGETEHSADKNPGTRPAKKVSVKHVFGPIFVERTEGEDGSVTLKKILRL